jgi:hypothetical protein
MSTQSTKSPLRLHQLITDFSNDIAPRTITANPISSKDQMLFQGVDNIAYRDNERASDY